MWRISANLLMVLCAIFASSPAFAQTFNNSSSGGFTQATSNPTAITPNSTPPNTPLPATPARGGSSRSAGPLSPISVAQGQPNLGRITAGTGVLPNDAGQVWREYDLTPYTSRVKDVEKPEQAIIDWILRETGTDAWFSTPLGILSADKNTLRVYHQPQMQEVVKGIYDRFLSNSAESNRLGVKIITVNSPNWRVRALPIMKPVEVKSAGVEAWLLPRENAVQLMNELRQRADVKEQNSAIVDITNGQSKPLGLTRPRSFVRSIRPRSDGSGGFEGDMATIEEGYAITLSPLASADGKSLDLVVKCNIDQLERLIEVPVDVPTVLGTTQRISLQVPQLVSWRLHERFRWSTDQVLLLSCGVVAAPANEARTLPLLGGLMGNPRADALLFIEPILATTSLALPLPLAGQNALPLPLPNTAANVFSTGNFGGNSANRPFIATPLMPSGRVNDPWRR